VLLEEVLPRKTKINDFEVKHNFPSIGERIMLINGCEIYRDQSEEKLIMLVIEDVTERKQHEAKEAELLSRFQNLVIHAPIAICILKGVDFRIELANNAFYQITGKEKQLTDQPLLDFLPELKEQGITEILENVNKTGYPFLANEMEIKLNRNNNFDPGYFNCVFQPQKDHNGKITGIMVVTTEVTEQVLLRKKINSDQKIHEMELEEKVFQRTQELSEANEMLKERNKELAKMNKELESFTYVSSHDLQEPLRKIQTFSMRILEKEFDVLSEKGKDYFRRMQSAAERMRQLIQDLIAFSKINMDEKIFETIHLGEILNEIKLDLKDTILDKNVSIENGELTDITVVRFQFRQLLNNLVSNSIKFARAGVPSKIQINAESIQAQNTEDVSLIPGKRYTKISIVDNGIGFEPRYKEQIFEVFQRLHGQEEYPGTGIGLAIVKKIIENHNGFITTVSELNNGATFVIFIPE
jgi:two-component system CheB/CheR fusion protein